MVGRIHSQLRNQWMGALALFLVLAGGGAYAAFDPVGSDGDIDACYQKRSGDLDLQKGKRCGHGERRVSWSQAGPRGPQGERGQQGPAGDTGPPGVPGTSIFDSSIPSGKTVTGAWGGNFAPVLNQPAQESFAIGFPVKAPSVLSATQVNTAPHASAMDPDPACAGSLGTPTAPPGKVCIYIGGPTPTYVKVQGYKLIAPIIDPPVTGDDLGFTILASYDTTGSGNQTVTATGTWAYTAP